MTAGADLSPWINRVGGYLVRALAPAIAIVPAVLIGGAIGGVIGALLGLVGYVFGIAATIRQLIQRGHLGYDIGDAVVGQRLVSDNTGQPLGSGMTVFLRSLAHIVDAIPCYVGFLWPLWDAKNQTFADKIMTTVVPRESTRAHTPAELLQNAFMFWTPVTKS